ncbi:hypothetical protein CP061683_0305A, partial [Chlamydia psittaci 06-1683]
MLGRPPGPSGLSAPSAASVPRSPSKSPKS